MVDRRKRKRALVIKRFLIAFVLLVLVCGGIVGFNLFRDRAIQQYFANMPVVPLTVSTAKVEHPVSPSVTASRSRAPSARRKVEIEPSAALATRTRGVVAVMAPA